jgi:hypothetical protein
VSSEKWGKITQQFEKASHATFDQQLSESSRSSQEKSSQPQLSFFTFARFLFLLIE